MRPRVLVVDDHEIVRAGISTLLRMKWDYEVCGEAGNGAEAIYKVRELKPDVVILDLNMPSMSGVVAAKEIRSIAPETKIIFLSVYDPEIMEQLGKLGGADAGVSKKSRTEELHKAIALLVGGEERPENRIVRDNLKAKKASDYSG